MVYLVPAHGMSNVTRGKRDPGAVGSDTDEAAISAELTADVAKFVDAFTDVTIVPMGTLDDRVLWLIAHMQNGDWAFSLHMNSGGGTGTEVVYDDAKPGYRDEAEHLSKAIATGLGLKNRGAKPDSATPRKYLGLVSRPRGASFIVETAFQDRQSDVAAVRAKGASVIAEAIRTLIGAPHPVTPPLMPESKLSPEFQAAFDAMKKRGTFSEFTKPGTVVTTETLAVFVGRLIEYLKTQFEPKR